MTPRRQWIVTADSRRASLFCGRHLPGGGWHLESRRSIESPRENMHERHRPSVLGRGPSANAAQHFASLGHEVEEEHRRFARDVRAWLAQAVQDLSVKRVTIFAATRFLGLLREELGDLAGSTDLRDGELTHLGTNELAEHPAVLKSLDWPNGRTP